MKYYHYIIIAIAIIYLTSKIYPFVKRKLRGYVNYIAPSSLKKRMDGDEDFLIVDVRTPKDFIGIIGHINGAINLPYNGLEELVSSRFQGISENLKNTPVVITSDFDEEYAFKSYIIFLKYGFKEVYLLDNGLSAWIKNGYFVTKDASQ